MFQALFDGVEAFWWLLILIGVMIIIHELGHYWAARFFDVKVEAFSFGFGPRLFGFRKGETDFRFSAILLGGYVKMAGEQPGDEPDPRGFLSKPRWQRLIVVFAGPFMNIALAVAIMTGWYMVNFRRIPQKPNPVVGYLVPDGPAAKAGVKLGDQIVEVDGITNPLWGQINLRLIDDINKTMKLKVVRDGQKIDIAIPMKEEELEKTGGPGWMEEMDVLLASYSKDKPSPAEEAGLKEGDIFRKVNGRPIRSQLDVIEAVQETKGEPLQVVYLRDKQEGTVSVKPVLRKVDESRPERWSLGVYTSISMEVTKLSFPDAFQEAVKKSYEGAGLIYKFLRGLVERRLSARNLSGPVGMAREAKRAAREGLESFLELMVMVSINLAVFNLLPIPILDGGSILLLLVEMIRRQDLSMRVKENVFKMGFAFLMMVVAFVLYNDISKVRADAAREAETVKTRPANR